MDRMSWWDQMEFKGDLVIVYHEWNSEALYNLQTLLPINYLNYATDEGKYKQQRKQLQYFLFNAKCH